MELTGKQRAFLNNLADLCEEYQAGFGYTVDDDGIPGFLHADAGIVLRAAATEGNE